MKKEANTKPNEAEINQPDLDGVGEIEEVQEVEETEEVVKARKDEEAGEVEVVGKIGKVKEVREVEEIDIVLETLLNNPKVQQMKQYMQHGRISTYDHCEAVARLSYKLNKRLHLHADNTVLLRSAMLHDFYLYDWHEIDNGEHNWHGYIHADRAAYNARKYFNISPSEQHVISSHMWPLNITHLPLSKEAWIVCMADKAVSLKETLFRR